MGKYKPMKEFLNVEVKEEWESFLSNEKEGEEEKETKVEEVKCINTAAAAKASLYALVKKVNEDLGCGYTADQMNKMVKNLVYTCREQVAKDKASYKNKRSLLHSGLEEAASTMCYLGLEKMNQFDPKKANFSTFLSRVYHNECVTAYNERKRDARYHAVGFDSPLSSEDGKESFTFEDILGDEEKMELEASLAEMAQTASYQYLMEYACKHLTKDEYKVFSLRIERNMTDTQIANALDWKKKAVQNAYGRAITKLRDNAMAGLNGMLKKKYGYSNAQEMRYDIKNNPRTMRGSNDTVYDYTKGPSGQEREPAVWTVINPGDPPAQDNAA